MEAEDTVTAAGVTDELVCDLTGAPMSAVKSWKLSSINIWNISQLTRYYLLQCNITILLLLL